MSASLHPITNWPQYNRSLINRGSLTFRVDAEAMNNWFHHDHHGRRDRPRLYTDLVIDSTGLKVFGEGEWKVRKPGVEKRRVWGKQGPVYADGTDDSKTSHRLIARKGAAACIPPCKSAGLWEKGHPRNEALLVMSKEGLAHWKKMSPYLE